MNFLHSFLGVGAFLGPFTMSFFVKLDYGWRADYIFTAFILCFIALVVFLSRKIWINKNNTSEEKVYILNKEALKIPLVKSDLISFSFFSYIELTTGLWISSYFIYSLGISEYCAALITAFFFTVQLLHTG